MRKGNLVRHKVSNHTALVVYVHEWPKNVMMDVLTSEGPGKWSISKCEVISEGR